jgi:hypothetical protein
VKIKKFLYCIFLFGILSLYPHAHCFSATIKDSIGRIAFRFAPVKIKIYNDRKQPVGYSTMSENICNGFLVKKEKEIYFITVERYLRINKDAQLLPYGTDLFYEILDERKFPQVAVITLPGSPEEIPVTLDKNNAITGDKVRYKKQQDSKKEDIDLLCIRVTTSIEEGARSNILPYEDLASESEKTEIDSHTSEVFIGGYPAADPKKGYEELPAHINQPANFGGLLLVDNAFISAFTFDTRLDTRDCGRPILMHIDSRDVIIGLVERMQFAQSSEWIAAIAIDSTAIRRIIDTMHKQFQGKEDKKEEDKNG